MSKRKEKTASSSVTTNTSPLENGKEKIGTQLNEEDSKKVPVPMGFLLFILGIFIRIVLFFYGNWQDENCM